MTKLRFILSLICFVSVCIGCSGQSISRPESIQNAENYTREGLHAFSEEQWNQAQRLFTRALSLYQGLDDQQGILQSHINLIEVALSMHNYQVSQAHLGLAAAMTLKPILADYRPRITLLYAMQAIQQGRIAQAETRLQILLPPFKEDMPETVPDSIQMVAIANRTKIAFMQNKGQALWVLRYANALKISSIKNIDLEARLLRFQASLLQKNGDYDHAGLKLQQALSSYKNNFSRTGIAVTLSELGELYIKQEKWRVAEDYFNRSIAVYAQLHDEENRIRVSERLAKILSHIQQGEVFN